MHASPQLPSHLFRIYAGRRHFEELLSATSLPSAQFLAEYIPMAERLALCVQELPLSPTAFGFRGGALMCGLQAGLLAVKSCDATIFEPKATAQERQRNDPLFRWAAYCAALANAYLLCAGQVQVEVGGRPFSFAGSVALGGIKKDYQAHWQESKSRLNECGFAYLQNFFHPGQFSHLEPSLLSLIGGAINPSLSTSHSETSLARVVRTSLLAIIEAEQKREKTRINGVAPAPDTSAPAYASPGAPAAETEQASAEVAQIKSSTPPQSAGVSTNVFASDLTTAQEPGASNPKKSAPPENSLPPKLLGWISALARAQAMDGEIVVEEQKIRFSRKALNFGGPARENYTILYEGGVVEEKGADFVICSKTARDAYMAVKDAAAEKTTG